MVDRFGGHTIPPPDFKGAGPFRIVGASGERLFAAPNIRVLSPAFGTEKKRHFHNSLIGRLLWKEVFYAFAEMGLNRDGTSAI